ncbi:hypothetical protein OHC33_000007 [Knufia fluminis]|uniref:Uncharacterized protein n=1 Tax=Knufia fluminis TaxID=191047 RepID=A0AAN8FGJ7_9EURO|nr:hypothetical protein OHC33_000007 [Knufia fluminis]
MGFGTGGQGKNVLVQSLQASPSYPTNHEVKIVKTQDAYVGAYSLVASVFGRRIRARFFTALGTMGERAMKTTKEL